jgi:hypothetical protein
MFELKLKVETREGTGFSPLVCQAPAHLLLQINRQNETIETFGVPWTLA